jgi:hypothetical protein
LLIVLEKGFYTLVEVLLDGGAASTANQSRLLWVTIDHNRIDLTELLLSRGFIVDAVDFKWLCFTGKAEFIKLFLDKGADPYTGFPFYHGFLKYLMPLVGIFKTYLPKYPELQLQADMALSYFTSFISKTSSPKASLSLACRSNASSPLR